MDKLTVETLRCEELRTLNIADLFIIISFTLLIAVLFIVVLTLIILYVVDRKQKQHPVLRNYPLIGRVRYFLETIGRSEERRVGKECRNRWWREYIKKEIGIRKTERRAASNR